MKWYVEEDSDIHKMKSSVPLEVCASAIILGMRMMNFYMERAASNSTRGAETFGTLHLLGNFKNYVSFSIYFFYV